MKALIVIVVLGLAGLVGYNYFTTGEVRVLPRTLSAEELEIQELESQLASAKRQFEQAAKAAGISGADFTAQAEAARRQVEKIEEKLSAALERLEDKARTEVGRFSERAAERARALKRAVEAFKRELQ